MTTSGAQFASISASSRRFKSSRSGAFSWMKSAAAAIYNEASAALNVADGRMIVSDRPGLGVTLSDQLRAWTVDTFEVGAR